MAEHAFDYRKAKAGDHWPALATPPVSRLTLALYCGASGDHNPLHVDQDFARDAGLGDVIAHGMLVMAYMSRALTDHVPQTALRGFDTRFLAMTRIGHAITVTGEVESRITHTNGETCLRVNLTARDQHAEAKAAGTALIAVS